MNYTVFIVLFLIIANRHVVEHLLERLWREKITNYKSDDKKILDLIYLKTGLRLPHFWVYDTHDFWGLMAGIPGRPQMFLSTYALNNFSDDELDWLLLHESGHYVLGHTIKEAIYQSILIAVGVFALWQFNTIYLAIALGLLLGVMGVQMGKHHEYEAEMYALSRVTNPQGMIHSGERGVRKWYKNRGIVGSLLRKLFNRWEATMHYHRIGMAKHELKIRKHRARNRL